MCDMQIVVITLLIAIFILLLLLLLRNKQNSADVLAKTLEEKHISMLRD